jgi:hypothetical protein
MCRLVTKMLGRRRQISAQLAEYKRAATIDQSTLGRFIDNHDLTRFQTLLDSKNLPNPDERLRFGRPACAAAWLLPTSWPPASLEPAALLLVMVSGKDLPTEQHREAVDALACCLAVYERRSTPVCPTSLCCDFTSVRPYYKVPAHGVQLCIPNG